MSRVATAVSFAALAVASTCITADARTATAAERAACAARIQPKIDAIDAKLRAGYSVTEGEYLLEKRRKLEDALAKCRTVLT
jgi:hypothetical protein